MNSDFAFFDVNADGDIDPPSPQTPPTEEPKDDPKLSELGEGNKEPKGKADEEPKADDNLGDDPKNAGGNDPSPADADPNEGGEDFNVYQVLGEAIYEHFGADAKESGLDLKTAEDFIKFFEETVSAQAEENRTYASPVSKEFDEYLAHGGDPAKFFEVRFANVDYNQIKPDSVDNQKRIISDYLSKVKQLDTKSIEKLVKSAEADDELESLANSYHAELVKNQEDQATKLIEDQKAQEKAKYESIKKSREEFSKQVMLADENALGYKATPKEKEAFLNWLFTPQKSGKTGYQETIEKTPFAVMRMNFGLYKGFLDPKKVDQLASKKAIERLKSFEAKLSSQSLKPDSKDKDNTKNNDYSHFVV
jgi:hypothetical protein